MLAFYLAMLESEEDKNSFTKLYEQFRFPCYHVALKITQSRELAEDAVHNAFIAVIKHKDEIFDLPCGKWKSKIVIITKNKAIDLIRAEKTRAYSPIDDMGDAASADGFDISSVIEDQEAYEYLINCIGSLPEIYISALEMRCVLDMSNQEISDYLGITPKAVSMRISRAKIMLKDLMNRSDKNE
jgi:RNA polymerase sigma-70 factor (ECF subfamily)